METEELDFSVTISGTYWNSRPEYKIMFDDNEVASGVITEPSDSPVTIEFTGQVASEDTEHCVSVFLTNKKDEDTVENDDKSAIIKDMLLNIHQVEINGIPLDALLWTHSQYFPEGRPAVTRCVNLGWNGAWQLKFTTPYYLWILENT